MPKMVKGALPECPKQPTKEKNKMEGKLKKGKQNKQKERKKKKKKGRKRRERKLEGRMGGKDK